MENNNSTVWQGNQYLEKSDSDTKNPASKGGGLVKRFLKNSFWFAVALLNILIFGDLFINGGSNLINLFFYLTGGY